MKIFHSLPFRCKVFTDTFSIAETSSHVKCKDRKNSNFSLSTKSLGLPNSAIASPVHAACNGGAYGRSLEGLNFLLTKKSWNFYDLCTSHGKNLLHTAHVSQLVELHAYCDGSAGTPLSIDYVLIFSYSLYVYSNYAIGEVWCRAHTVSIMEPQCW